jgi:hypothetical protein
MWKVYRSVRLRFGKLAPGYVLHGNILLRDASAVYFWVPKVACSTFKKVCADYLSLAVDGNDVAETIHHLDFPYVKKYQVRAECQNLYTFAFVRNPWDRLVSCYNDKICDEADHIYERHENRFVKYLRNIEGYRPGMTFEDFVNAIVQIPNHRAEGHLRSQASFLSDAHGVLPLTKVGRFETLANDFHAIATDIGLTQVLPHLRSSGNRDYRDYYSVKMRELVRNRYQADVELFRYDF